MSGAITPRSVFVLDITDFRPMVSGTALKFLGWLTRDRHDSGKEPAADQMQAGAGGRPALELRGAWHAVDVTGHKQFRAFSIYECHGGQPGLTLFGQPPVDRADDGRHRAQPAR